jgi:hypothetical protein
VGPRGLAVLSLTGIAGVLLGVLGWDQRGLDMVPPPPPASASSSPAAGASPSPTATPSASGAAGPQLSSMPYASFAFQVWPGPVSADGKRALSGWTLSVTRQAGGITVKATLDGQSMSAVSHFYPSGARVYILDSGLSTYVGDKGLEVTNAQGQVLP